jgi:hypothetical protein
MRVVFLYILIAAIVAAACGCEAKSSSFDGSGDSDSDSDSDTDTDTDSDTDSDSDSDTDTGYEGPPIPETCEAAAEVLTSVGCEFYVADLDNYVSADPLTYAVVVSNPQESSSADVKVEDMRGPGNTLRTVPGTDVDLAAGELVIFELTCATGCPETTAHIDHTGFAPLSAFRLVSDVPVLAYQWNTYGTGLETTDASLLIPTTSLEDVYIGAVWHSGPNTGDRSEITVVATEDGTQVTFTPSVTTNAGGSVPSIPAGTESAAFDLNAFDVIQIEPSVEHADLTGTLVSASAPVAVFGGHSCAMVPTPEFYACDHVEEQLLPLTAWGVDTVLARYAPRDALTMETDEALWRIVAGADGMTVYFDPAVDSVGASYHFDSQGEVLEFLSPVDHYATAELDDPPDPEEPGAPFFAYQMMTGRFYVGGGSYQWGDPMMLLSPPAGQYLDRYVFNTDSKFDFAFDRVIVVRQAGVPVDLDCLGVLPDEDFVAVGASDFEVGRFALDYNGVDVGGCEDGAHYIWSEEPFAVSVVGEDFANSYGYLGGVGVRSINPVVVE